MSLTLFPLTLLTGWVKVCWLSFRRALGLVVNFSFF